MLEPLSFSRDAIADGEVWRLLTAAFAHLSWQHLAGNLVALALVTQLLRRHVAGAEMLAALGVSALAATLGLYFGSPVGWYVGASAAIYGLLSWGALRLPMPAGFGVCALVLLMIVLDRNRTVSWAGEPLVAASHYWGVVGGLGFALVSRAAHAGGFARLARISLT